MSQHAPDFTHFGRIVVLYGGASAERPVSLNSGQAVLSALKSAGADVFGLDTAEQDYLLRLQAEAPDRAFIALHGRGGEDGRIQAVLEALGISYTGCGVAASAIGMNKLLTKQIWQASGLPVAESQVLSDATDCGATLAALGGKAVLKPVLEGSSLGISIVSTPEAMSAGYAAASGYDSTVIAERFIDGPEYTVAIVGDQALPVIRMEAQGGFYDYAAKYERNDTQYFLPSGLSQADERELQALALSAYRALDGRGWCRIDAMRDQAGRWYLLEINTVPGLTSHSLVPMAAQAAGMNFTQLIWQLLDQVNTTTPGEAES